MMIETEVKELFGRILDTPTPAMTDRAITIHNGLRAQRRARWRGVLVAVAGAGVSAVVGLRADHPIHSASSTQPAPRPDPQPGPEIVLVDPMAMLTGVPVGHAPGSAPAGAPRGYTVSDCTSPATGCPYAIR